MTSLSPSSPEVAHFFHLPFSDMITPARVRVDRFRGIQPYWAINVSDLTEINKAFKSEDGHTGNLEVWGLTGWYLGLLMKAFQVYQ